jgi:hypothetical protein
MAKKKRITIKLDSYILKKRFKTSEKTYEIGDTFSHKDARVINFLKQQEII